MTPSDDRVAHVIHKALADPLRRQLMLILTTEEKPMAPVDLEPHIEGSLEPRKLSRIAYHVRHLEKVGLVSLVKTEPVRGVVKHLFGPTELFTADLLDMLALDAIAELFEDTSSDATDDVLDRIVGLLAASGRPIPPPEEA